MLCMSNVSCPQKRLQINLREKKKMQGDWNKNKNSFFFFRERGIKIGINVVKVQSLPALIGTIQNPSPF